MDTPKPDYLSIVAPAYNEEENLVGFYQRIRTVVEEAAGDFELILVDDGSEDSSLGVLKKLHRKDSRVKYLSLSRHFGFRGALVAGLEYSKGDAVISIDMALQHPPELISEMLRMWKEGYEVVYTIKREYGSQGFPRRLIDRILYSVLGRLMALELTGGEPDFRLMDRKVVDAFCKLPERNQFLGGLTRWIGFRQTGLVLDLPPRKAGESKIGFLQLVGSALDEIFSFSVVPLRLFTFVGALVSAAAFLYLTYVLIRGIGAYVTGDYGRIPPGWPELAAGISFFGGIQLLGIGLLGEYLGRVYDEVKRRPAYIVREHSLDNLE